MAPEYGATIGFFTVDEATISYFKNTGRTDEEVSALESYFRAQGMFGIPKAGQIDYTRVVNLDLGSVTASVSGPRRPQDRIELGNLKKRFYRIVQRSCQGRWFQQETG